MSNKSLSENSIAFISPAGDPIAKVGSTTLTVEYILKDLNEKTPYWSTLLKSSALSRENFLEGYIRKELLSQQAVKLGYLDDQEIQTEIKEILSQRLIKDKIDNSPAVTQISDEDLKAYYDANNSLYNRPEKMRAQFAFIPFGKNKTNSLKKANELWAEVSEKTKKQNKKEFKTLAQKYYDFKNTKDGGSFKYMAKEEMTTKFGKNAQEALWAIKGKYQVSSVTKGKDGYYIFMHTGKRKKKETSFEQAKKHAMRKIKKERKQEQFDRYLNELKKSFEVTVYLEKLSKLNPDDAVASK
ncbi:peptidyl-prolyl cis-trans isomerase [Sulfobacillus acidophilus]|uniref:Peptidyl-prolyl cis-trans isomerase n=1 Tax=Sulfobacillus acidophilus TaxID=53633 RepID=A0ABS3AVJ0_9FIRM|nr:peptidyl-prolyl cis-trans isomerase [Sulfobacillus acidophilus]